ncbi:hypothetical protein Egran_04020 [Elaphomyces granulatus]|uniref:Uncharacterized protein n=1 Tax=Elaphomyces granulatus TaxID=519963 RepID=A0A232LVN8_9EURO|nr:hypothetical protein Egran_04020 [Elaphomyces granulatus]
MFSVIIPGRPCLTEIVTIDAQPNLPPTNFVFTFPANPTFNHIVVFLLPGTVLPPDTAATIYMKLPESKPSPSGPQFRFLGAIGNEKPSAIFKIRAGDVQEQARPTEEEEEDEMLDEDASRIKGMRNENVTLGISIEPTHSVIAQLAALNASSSGSSTALVHQTPLQKQITVKVLAQRIITNAFNFLASFAEPDPKRGGEEIVTLKSFREWWSKFERRLDVDPEFLEREDPGRG